MIKLCFKKDVCIFMQIINKGKESSNIGIYECNWKILGKGKDQL